MPNLNDYIGSLVSSITNARVMSDLQTVKIAEEYSNHKLLQHFSIPRMRIDDIEMTIPIGLQAADAQLKKQIEPINASSISALLYNAVLSYIGLSKLKSDITKLIQTSIVEHTDSLAKNITVLNYDEVINASTKSITDYTSAILHKNGIQIKRENLKISPILFAKSLATVIKGEVKIIEKNIGIDYLDVIVEANKLRELKPETLIYVKLKIREDGMEWNRSENNNGVIENKLLPE